MVIKKIDANSYIFLDTFDKGQSGVITLKISLDGETQGNDYQDTLADLAMEFAAELNGSGTTIKTGDTQNPLVFFVVMTAAGIVLLAAVFYLVNKRRKRGQAS